MSAGRVAFTAALVAAAWATAITGVTAAGAAKAEAAWLKTGSGSSFAAAWPLAVPSGPSLSNQKCNNSGNGPSVTVSWGYPIATLPPKFEVLLSSTANNPNPTVAATTTTAMSATITLPSTKTSYLSVRAVAGSWQLRSGEVSVC